MLYPKNQTAQLDDALFQKPTCEYRGAPFWAWNCKLDRDMLLQQILYLKEMGFGGFHMHVRTGMATPYLSQEYMDLIRSCVDKAEDEEMLAWLYDEDRWPSGAAGGLVTKDPQYRQRFVLFTREERTDNVEKDQAVATGKPWLMACFDILLNPDGTLADYRQIAPSDAAEGKKWYAYVCTPKSNPWYNNQTYIDTMNPEAVQAFIKLTYEGYKAQIGDRFSKTVPAIFTDEPQFSYKETLPFATDETDVKLPWSMDVPETFQKAYGDDIVAHFPELIWDLPDGAVSIHRYHYHDHLAERFASSFADQCGGWCEKNNLRLTGHVLYEESLQNQTRALGEAMRSYRSFQIPGIDMLCDNIEFTTAKQAQSAVHQYGAEGMLSELYGVTHWDFDFRGHKFQGDWQAALGVTVRVPHLSWVSMAGEAKRDYPASINYQSPWFRQYPYIEDHFARLNTALTRGKPVVRVGVIHPIESYWLHWGPAFHTAAVRAQLEEQFQNLTKWLLLGCIDFDFISESLLPGQCAQAGAPLQVGKMAYDTIVVPGCETLRRTTLDRLKAFQEQGGRLIFLGEAPAYLDAVPSDEPKALYQKAVQISFDANAVLTELDPARDIEIWNGDGTRASEYIYQLREDTDCRWLFIARGVKYTKKDLSCPRKLRIVLRGQYTPVLYDTLNGDKKKLSYRIEDGTTVIEHTLYASDSLLLHLTAASAADSWEAEQPQKKLVYTASLHKKVSYRREEPNVLLMDQAEYALDGGDFAPVEEILRLDNICREQLGWPSRTNDIVQPWVADPEEITHRLTLRFTINSEVDLEGCCLAIEDAEKLEITLNGTPVSNQICGYYVDAAIKKVALPAIRKGENILVVTMPFGRTTNTEWCYLLGEFNVRLEGTETTLLPPTTEIGFSSITEQGLPFYGGNLTYRFEADLPAGDLVIRASRYRGAAMRVAVDGEDKGILAFDPYTVTIEGISAGKHTIELTLYGNRYNSFGTLHDTGDTHWSGPNLWRTTGYNWCYEYRLRDTGILSSPVLEVYQADSTEG